MASQLQHAGNLPWVGRMGSPHDLGLRPLALTSLGSSSVALLHPVVHSRADGLLRCAIAG
jgi:hypothetical protein